METHIEYVCKKLAKCVGIISKARKKLHKPSLITLYYSFAFPYLTYCNHVWGNNYPTTLAKLKLIQKRLIRIITCSPYRAHTEPLLYAHNLVNVTDINVYIVGIFMYHCLLGDLPDIFDNFFVRNRDVHQYNVRNADDLHVAYARLDIRKFSLKINGANIWNALPEYVKGSTCIGLFKQNLRNFLTEKYLVYYV